MSERNVHLVYNYAPWMDQLAGKNYKQKYVKTSFIENIFKRVLISTAWHSTITYK